MKAAVKLGLYLELCRALELWFRCTPLPQLAMFWTLTVVVGERHGFLRSTGP